MSVLSHTVGVCKRCARERILSRASMEDLWLCDRCIYHEYSALRAVIAERDALKKTVDMAAILLNRYEERWGPLT